MNKFKGTGVALITPFNDDGSIDYISLEKLLFNAINNNINYLVLMGTTAESATLSKDEMNNVVSFCKKINNSKLPLVLGIGGNNTNQIVSDLKNFDFGGIDAILSVSPYYNRPTQEGIYEHYKLISENSPLPIILYNVPSRTSSHMSSDLIVRLANDFSNIIGVKEASGDMFHVMDILKNRPDRFLVISGDDALTLPIINLGGDGVISVIAQAFPKKYSEMVNKGLSGEFKSANRLHFNLWNFYKPLYAEGNPVGIKALLELLGISKSIVRKPLLSASKSIINELSVLVKQ